jgi:NADH-quinone oxidoreductase subunit L
MQLPLLLGAAWLLPLASFTLIVFFGPRMGKAGYLASYIATGAILGGFVLSATSFVLWMNDVPTPADESVAAASHDASDKHAHGDSGSHDEHASAPPRAISGTWYQIAQFSKLRVTISYYIDALTIAMFCMVTLIATCIHFYAIGYMHDELHDITDHEVIVSKARPHGHGHDTGHETRHESDVHAHGPLGGHADEAAHGHAHADVDHPGLPPGKEFLKRPGRFYRFFQYLSLFCFSMLGLVISGNIAMVFVFWELVGICSYFLIGFYIERKSASNAANKAFIVNRVGDFGMLIGLMALFGSLGTFAFGDIDTNNDTKISDDERGVFSQVRTSENNYALVTPVGMVNAVAGDEINRIRREHAANPEAGELELKSRMNQWRTDWQDMNVTEPEHYGKMAYWLLCIAGVGIFCGCVGKSAQFPLHVWLPDAMEGPTPVSALVHSATMVAAGVYLVGRFYPVFTPEVLLVIAYVGMITLFLAASIAITATDIKRVLAYSTVSQLGYMMLSLGVGGWLAGMFHLITHAFFKSLLFMCSGSVIHACHTNEMPKMGGLRHKMPWTAYTMLVGCLAIIGAGIPFLIGFSGYYSKDAIIAQALSFWNNNPTHGALFFVAAAGGAAMTAFYMFRLWFMTFAGKPRDQHIYDHAHESPPVMYLPLALLSFFAVGAGWHGRGDMVLGVALGIAIVAVLIRRASSGASAQAHDAHAHHDDHAAHDHGHAHGGSSLRPLVFLFALAILAAIFIPPAWNINDILEQARPAGATGDGKLVAGLTYPHEHISHEHATHVTATIVAFSTAMSGLVLAILFYGIGVLSPNDVRQQFSPIYRFLLNKWYFDELYNTIFVRPTHFVSGLIAKFDKRVIDGIIDGLAWCAKRLASFDDLLDRYLVDGIVNLTANWTFSAGRSLRSVQTGKLRQYVMLIVIGTVALTVYFKWQAAKQATGPAHKTALHTTETPDRLSLVRAANVNE